MKRRLRYLAYPPTSLPIRDLFVLEHVPFTEHSRVLEIGVGPGGLLARLSAECVEVVGVDISKPAIDGLGYLKKRFRNLNMICADVESDEDIGKRFDVIISLDTLEHVSRPERFFSFAARHLAEGGTAHVLFPNEITPARHGVTSFESEERVRAAIGSGFQRIEVFSANLKPWPRAVVALFHGWHRICGRRRRPAQHPPQRFDETAFFRRRDLWVRLSPLINFYWHCMLLLCGLTGHVYEVAPARTDDFAKDTVLYIRLSAPKAA